MSHGPSLAIILKCADGGHALGGWFGITKGPFDPDFRRQMRQCNCGQRYESKESAWLVKARAERESKAGNRQG